MSSLEGVLLVEQDDASFECTGTYLERYFVSLPLCGMRWYLEKPVDVSSLYGDEDAGWLYGGDIRVESVRAEKVRLACKSEHERTVWVHEIRSSVSMQTYLTACSDSDCVPSQTLFSAVSNVTNRSEICLEDFHITTKTLLALVKYIKLSAPHGVVLETLTLKNAQLGDQHAESLCSLLLLLPHLKSLTLSGNYLTCEATTLLAESAFYQLPGLTSLDMSSNLIGDSGLEALVIALAATAKELSRIDLSRNNLSPKSVQPSRPSSTLLRLASHNSKISHINLAYNDIGDGAAAVVSLLMRNKPAILSFCDVSFCGISEMGMRELASAILECSSLQCMKVRGCFSSLSIVIEAMSSHQKKFRSLHRLGLSVHVGGMLIENYSPKSLSLEVSRRALPNVEDHTLLQQVILRPRPFFELAHKDSEKKVDDIMTIVCLRIKLPPFLFSVEEALESLASAMGAHPRQLRVLSSSDLDDDTRSCYIIFTVEEPTESMLLCSKSQFLFPEKLTSKLPPTLLSQKLENNVFLTLPSADALLQSLEASASASDPHLRMLGVRTVFIQRPKSVEEEGKNKDLYIFKCHIRGSGSGGRSGQQDEYVPSLFPARHGVPGLFVDELEGGEGDDEEEEEEEEGRGVALGVNKAVTGGVSDEAERRFFYHHQKSIHHLKQEVYAPVSSASERVGRSVREKEMSLVRATAKREMRAANGRLVLTIRQLRRENELTSSIAKFWEGALGNTNYQASYEEEIKKALNERGIFHAVGYWQQLCEAMVARDMPAMSSTIAHIKSEKLDGGTCLVFGQRLLSELLSLQRDAINLPALAVGADDICLAEDFLLMCGRLSYSGPEMFAAVDLRQKLVMLAAKERPEVLKGELEFIKQRALLSNLMISRDFEGLERTLEAIAETKHERMSELSEVFAAKKLLADSHALLDMVRDANKTSLIPDLETALAQTAYFGISATHCVRGQGHLIEQVSDELFRLCNDPKRLLRPILTGLRESDSSKIEAALDAAREMGWSSPAIADSIPLMINAKNAQLLATESTKAHLVRLALAVKNGFVVNAGEMMQLLRRAEAFKLSSDPSLRVYFEALEKHMKKFTGVLKQEETIQKMIDERDIVGLNDLLCGRGSGKLIVNAPSSQLAHDWIEVLRSACQFVDDGEDDNGTLMVGTMEKAARTETGALKGWRHRYFVLKQTTLSYYTSKDGELKGVVRVTGGAVRMMRPEEASGRQHCFELQEGRDISVIDPDLLEEARKLVNLAKKEEVEKAIDMGMRKESLEILEKALAEVEAGLQIEFSKLRKAKIFIKHLHEKQLKREIHNAARTVPRGHIEELLQAAFNLQIDPNNSLLKGLVKVAEQTEITQIILRARGAMENHDEASFKRSITALSRLESKRFSIRDSRMLTAIILQHAGFRFLRGYVDGESTVFLSRLIKYALACCRQLLVETEPMQLGKLLIFLAALVDGSSHDVLKGGHKSLSLASYLDDSKLNVALTSQFTIDKFEKLAGPDGAPSTLSAKTATFLSSMLSSSSAANVDNMSFTVKALSKPLTRHFDAKDAAAAVNVFSAMQAVMGDRPVKSISNSKDSIVNKRPDAAWLASDLALAGIKIATLRDELYLQLCKQLAANPKVESRLRGWLLFAIYLHAFSPSLSLIPYLRNFLAHSANAESSLAAASVAKLVSSQVQVKGVVPKQAKKNLNEARQEEMDAHRNVTSVATYCTKLLSRIEFVHKDELSSSATGVVIVRELDAIGKEVAQCVLERAPVVFEVSLMTGSVYTFKVRFGDIDTPYSLLPLLYSSLVGGPNELRGISEMNDLRNKHRGSHAWADWLLKQFRGFSFFLIEDENEEEEDGEEDDTTVMGKVDEFPVQPSLGNILEWHADTLWQLVQKRTAKLKKRTPGKAHRPIEDTCCMRLVLRRSLSMSSETLAGQFELFGDQVADRDIVALSAFWSDWLSQNRPLPSDHIRVDLLFAEETRCVNSQLYASTKEAYEYLLAMQLSLSWEVTEVYEWGNGIDGVMGNVDLSVRPIYREIPLNANKQQHDDTDSIAGASVSEASNRVTPVVAMRGLSAYFRGSIVAAEISRAVKTPTSGKVAKSKKRTSVDDDKSSATSAISGSSDRVDTETVNEESDDEEDENEGEEDEDEDDESSSDASSEGISSDDTSESDEEKLYEHDDESSVERRSSVSAQVTSRRPKTLITGHDDMLPMELTELTQKMVVLGVNPSKVDMEALVNWIGKFHAIAEECGTVTASPHFRYMLKRAYLHYVSTWPLFGHHFSNASLANSQGEERQVVVGVSPNGLRLLDPSDWSSIMFAPLYDIETCRLAGEDDAEEDEEEDEEEEEDDEEEDEVEDEEDEEEEKLPADTESEGPDTDDGSVPSVSTLPKARDRASTRDSAPDDDEPPDSEDEKSGTSLPPDDDESSAPSDSPSHTTETKPTTVMTSRKARTSRTSKTSQSGKSARSSTSSVSGPRLFLSINGLHVVLVGEHAEEQFKLIGACCLEALGRGCFPHGTEGGNDVLDVGEDILPLSDTKEIMRRYIRDFPLLPVPPAPAPLVRSPEFIELPKSRREMEMEKRAEEELLEMEQARLAAEVQIERLQHQQEQGKKEVKSYSNDFDDEDEEDGGDTKGRKSKSHSKKHSRRLGSVFTTNGRGSSRFSSFGRQSLTMEALLQNKISSAVTGNPTRAPLRQEAPAGPQRKGGKLTIDRLASGGRAAGRGKPPQLVASAQPAVTAVDPRIKSSRMASRKTEDPAWGGFAKGFLVRSNNNTEELYLGQSLISGQKVGGSL